jgi:hypothetical protein
MNISLFVEMYYYEGINLNKTMFSDFDVEAIRNASKEYDILLLDGWLLSITN